MWGIAAYLAACLVAATIISLALVFRYGELSYVSGSMADFREFITYMPIVAAVIGAVMAIPSCAMVLVQEGQYIKMRACMIFGAIGMVMLLIIIALTINIPVAVYGSEETFQIAGTTVLFMLAGSAAGATYWLIAEARRT